MRSVILVGFFAIYTLFAQGLAADPADAATPGFSQIVRLVSGIHLFSHN